MKYSLRLMLPSVAMVLLMLAGARSVPARAASISEAQARAKAQSFLQSRRPLQSGKRLAPARTPFLEARATSPAMASTPALYVFNVGKHDGFVIVSGDDRARPILGYADSGAFDADRVPAALSEMLAIYARQIEQLDVVGNASKRYGSDTATTAGGGARAPKRISGQMADVAPLLTTTWDQGDPYNAYCPTLNDQTALTGCVATAMAQIAYYHKYPTDQVPNLAAYTSETNKINVSAWGGTTFDWDNMLPSYGGSYTNAQKTAVATLMRYCGQAAQMDYGFTSGAYNGDALYAFTQKLGYNANAAFRSAASYSADGWEDLIYREVSQQRPVYYSALDGEVGDVGGHAFVIDGYQADGNYFHVNWGWGGACNGYFNLFALDSSAPESAATSTGWHYQMLALVGLSPETVNTAKLNKDASGSWLITSTDDWNELAANLEAYNGGSFKLTSDISVTTMVGTEWQPFSGTFDGQGHVLNVSIESNEEYAAPFHCAVNCTFKNLTVSGTINVSYHFAGGLIGWAEEVTLQGCESKVTINSSFEGDGTHGGFISIVRGGTVRFYDCVFSGVIKGENTDCCGGFCGWRDGEVEVFNCLNIGKFELASTNSCSTFSRNGVTQTNSYYTASLAEAMSYNQGTSVTAEQLADGSVTRKLQDGSRDWTTGQVWGQKVGTDTTPLLTNDASKGIYKVSFTVDGLVVKTVVCNSPIGDKMPAGEDFGLTNATFTCNGSAFTKATSFSSDITVVVTGTAAYTLTLNKVGNGTVSINNNSCIPGTLKKVTATPANGFVVSTVTVTDANDKTLPVTQVSNNANEFVFVFPKSSVTVNAEFTEGEAEATRFINGGMTLPSSDQPWTADTWTIWCDEYGGDRAYVGTPPVDALGHKWYEEGYALTNSDADVQPNGNKVVWENHSAFFGSDGNYRYLEDNGASEDRACNFYFRRIFTFNGETLPSRLYLWFRYDDGPASFYLNGTLIYENGSRDCIDTALELTPEQMALIHTDGTPNVLAAWCTQIGGPYYIDCGLYDPTAISYEVTGENTVRVLRNAFITGDVVIPETVTANGVTYTVTELADDVFNECHNGLTSVSLPQTLTSLGNNVFWECDGLQYVKSYLPVYQNEWLIAAPAVATEYELPMGYSNIWNNAFKFTDKLTTLTLSRSLTYIGYNAFVGCTALTNIYAYARPVPQTEGNAFEGIDKSKITVHVYASALESYKESWGEEFQYVTMPDPQPVTLTIDVADRGTLRTLIEEAVAAKGNTAYDVVGITVTGTINQDDLRTLSEMCTGVYSLATINLSGATIEGNYIDNDMFRDREKLTSIALPTSVKRIRSYAFDNCPNLVSVSGLDGLDDAEAWQDWYVFGWTPSIEGDVYGGTTFLSLDKDATGEYEVPAGIKVIVGGAMHGRNITSVVIPASVTDLGNDVFRGCHQLKDFYVYATTPPVCHEGSMEYDYDKSQATLHVPASALEAYQNADEWRDMGRIVGIVTGELADMTINVATAGTLNDELFDAAVAEANISDKVLVRNLTVTGSINADDVAYLNTLPNTLYNMEMLDLSGTSLNGNAITERMFYASLYKAIRLPDGVTSIANEAFSDSRRLKEISLPAAVTTIEWNTFSGCSALSTVTFAENSALTRIEEYAFSGLASLKSIELPASLEYIGPHAFEGCGLTSITIPDNVTWTGDRVVQSCQSLKRITLGNGLTSVPECWAEFCDNLEEVTIGKRVTAIGWRAFPGFNIKNVYCYAKSAPSWDDAFYDGISSEAVLHVYSNSVSRYQNAGGWQDFPTILGDLGTYPTFDLAVNVAQMGTFGEALQTAMTAAGCEDMMDISKLTVTGNVNNDDLYYLRDKLGATLDVLDLGAVTVEGNYFGDYQLSGCYFKEMVLPANLEYIGWHVLEGCPNLKTLDIPGSVNTVCPHLLDGSSSLEAVTGGNGVTQLPDPWNGWYVRGCPQLQSPVIMGEFFFRLPENTVGAFETPENVTTITRHGMMEVSGLTALTLPESITTIYGYIFDGNVSLKDIYFYAVEVPSFVDGEAFGNFDCSGCTLHVYEEMVELFQSNELWAAFNIVGDLGAMPNLTPMAEADYADLCAINSTLGGDNWSTKWMTGKNVQTASRWSGVTFDEEGFVTAIDLHENGLSGDISELTFTGLTKLTSLNLGGNALTGDIQPLAASLPAGCKLNVGGQELGYVGEHTLYEMCQYGGLPSIAYWQSESGTLASTLVGVNGVCHFYHEGTDATNGQYWDCYIHADGGTANNFKFYWPSPATIECFQPHHFTFTYTYDMGDANMDDALNVLDLQSTLNYSNGQQWGLFNAYAADTYAQDGDVNVQDIVATVNILLEQEAPAAARTAASTVGSGFAAAAASENEACGSPAAAATENEACVTIENGQLVLYTTVPVAALDLRLSGIAPEALTWNTEALGFTTATCSLCIDRVDAQGFLGGTHAIIYSLQPREMAEGRTVLATYDASVGAGPVPARTVICDAVLCDSKARPVSVGFTMPTGIQNVEYGTADTNRTVYDLQGRKVNGWQKRDLYLENGKKVIIK